VSLGAELDGQLVGAVLGSIHYGEYGQAEPVAIVDTVLVDPGFQHRGVATALVEQFEKNVGALRVERLRTEVDWTERDLLGLFAKAGFAPGKRLVLERRVGDPGREEVGQVPHGQGPGTAGHP
jgi:GNAT superfamily N-acetyltransferase